MVRNLRRSFIVDTSAFISLEVIKILTKVLENFSVITVYSVIEELEQFSKHNDELGMAARNILKHKNKIVVRKIKIKEKIRFLEKTDNELYNLSLKENCPLITDDYKINHHTKNKIIVYFSTFFLIALASSDILTKKDALDKLEMLKDIRKWNDNIIYLVSKEELEKI